MVTSLLCLLYFCAEPDVRCQTKAFGVVVQFVEYACVVLEHADLLRHGKVGLLSQTNAE